MTADTTSVSARRAQAAAPTAASTAPAKPSPQKAEEPRRPVTRPVDRLTGRDATLLHLIAEHKVLTTTQITDALFTSGISVQKVYAMR